MSGSDRDAGTPPVSALGPESWFLPIVGIIFALSLAWFIGTLQGGEYVRRNVAPHQHAKSAKERAVKECSGTDAARVVECVQEQIETSEETARGEQDLTAQQQAAWGSMLGAVWGGLALLVTAVGTALLYQQIVLTRRAVEDTGESTEAMRQQNLLTKEATERQLRAYLGLKTIEWNMKLKDGDMVEEHSFALHWHNSGQTPARNVQAHVVIFTATNSPDWNHPEFGFIPPHSAISSVGVGQIMRSEKRVTVKEMLSYPKDAQFYIWAAAEYDDVFPDSPRRRTEMCSSLVFDGPLQGPGQIGLASHHVGPLNGFDEDCWKPTTTPKGRQHGKN